MPSWLGVSELAEEFSLGTNLNGCFLKPCFGGQNFSEFKRYIQYLLSKNSASIGMYYTTLILFIQGGKKPINEPISLRSRHGLLPN